MYNEGASEFVVDQGLYYPTATNYGYYCTGKLTAPIFCRQGLCLVVLLVHIVHWMWSGFESPSEWEDHHRIFGVDGPDIQYAVSENFLLYKL